MQFSVDLYKRALRFAATAHAGQLVPGSSLPYVVHVVGVAAEILAVAAEQRCDLDFALCCALLHDVLEDTPTGPATVEAQFGEPVRRAVEALSKRAELPKAERMADSLRRILALPPEVAMVKLADRITNLAPPPADWSTAKRVAYRAEAEQIAATLGAASAPLHRRLLALIEAYGAFLGDGASGTT